MKSITSIKRAFAAALAVIMILLVGCVNDGPEPTDPANLGKKHNLSFVVIDDSNWDKTVTLGNYTYTIHVNLNEDNTLEVVGTCTGEALAQGGGQGGGMGSDGAEADTTPSTEGSDSGEGESNGAESTPTTEAPAPTESTPATEGSDSGEGESQPTESTPATEGGNDSENGEQGNQGGQEGGESTPATTTPPMSDEDKKAQSFTQSGTWVYEKGLGYTITIEGVTTKTNYEKESGRTYFFFEIKHGKDADGNDITTGVIQFAAKDTGFRADLTDDYVRWEDRDAEVTFFAANNTTGGNNSSTRLWILPNGQAASLVYSGTSYTYKMGTWTKADNQNITVSIGGSDYLCAYCDTAGKEGYRVTYNSQLIYSRDDVEYVATDFDGTVVKSLQCAEGDYTLDLTSKGMALLMEVATNSDSKSGSYTEEGGVLTVVMGSDTFVSEGNTITISWTVSSGSDGSGTNETYSRTFNLE